MKPLDPEIRQRLEHADWNRIIMELADYADFLVRARRWKTAGDMLPKGFAAQDIACEAIRRVWEGDRQWNPDRDPDLLRHLKSFVKSLVYHLVTSEEHRTRATTRTDYRLEAVELALAQIPDSSPNPEQAFFGDVDEGRCQELANLVFACAKGDDEAELIILELQEGKKPREIAQNLGLSVERVYQCLQNLRRRVKSALRQ